MFEVEGEIFFDGELARVCLLYHLGRCVNGVRELSRENEQGACRFRKRVKSSGRVKKHRKWVGRIHRHGSHLQGLDQEVQREEERAISLERWAVTWLRPFFMGLWCKSQIVFQKNFAIAPSRHRFDRLEHR